MGAERSRPAARVRWGLGDAVIAWVVGLLATVFVAPGLGDSTKDIVALCVLILVQNVGIVAYLAWAARAKGLGSLRADFGFAVSVHDAPWLLGGAALQVAGLVVLAPLEEVHGHTAKQEVVKVLEHATGARIALIVLAVAVAAPVAEELLFRGALLRSLLRRTSPEWSIAISALVFGLVHLAGDPSIGTLIAFPVLVTLGLVSGYQAFTTGRLSRSILLHMGFNALTVVFLFV